MTAANREKSSIDWSAVRPRYEGERISIRALARELGTSDTEVRRQAKSRGWVRHSAQIPQKFRATSSATDAKTPMLWDFEPRRDALIRGLQRSRNGVDGVEDAIYADTLTVMALLWFRTPLAEIAQALQITEPMLEAIWGRPILAFIREFYSSKPTRQRSKRHTARRDKGTPSCPR